MKKYDLYIGCSVGGKEMYERSYVRYVIEQALGNAGFDGCTFTDAIGMWEGVSELTVICTVCTDRDREDIFKVVGLIREELRQDCVMVIESEPIISFI